MKFIDVARITLQAGRGGVGCVSFRREKFVPKGGPDGGDGGDGGSIIIRTNKQLSTLLDFQYRRSYAAPRGEHGKGANKTGKNGSDVVLEVPVGTVIRDPVTGEIIADMIDENQECIAARGGVGGRGNASFASSTNQAPREFTQGTEGEVREIELELKLLADIGLVGLPNAGKSTLIATISAAKPKIADYPFTTLVPNLGIVRIDEGKGFVVADIPGLIAGAHEGKGLGHQFLRHIERTRVLVFLLDGTSENPKHDYRTLLNELKLFDPSLVSKPRIVAITKMDAVETPAKKKVRAITFGRVEVHYISSVSGLGMKALVRAMWKYIHSKRL